MSSPLLDELHWLTEALRAHVDWTSTTGSLGLPRCDATWLEQRREHYRRTELREPDDSPWSTAAAFVPDAVAEPVTTSAPRSAPTKLAAQQHATEVGPNTPTTTGAPPRDTGVASAHEPVRAVLASLGSVANAVQPAPPASSNPRPTQAESKIAPVASSSGTPRPASSISEISPLDATQRQARLVTLHDEVRACRSCGLCEGRKQPAFSRGTGSSKVVFVGEGPGAEEDAQGIPFVGAAGQLLDRMIGAMGISRDDVYVCNIIKCRPPNNRKPTDAEIATCRHFVVDQLRLIEPQVIVALGATAVEGLLGLKLGITRLRGTWRLYEGRIPVMPTFHPAYLLRKPEAKREVWEDLQAVLARVNRPVPARG